MSLIKCPECGKEISDKAPACIKCGFPLSVEKSVEILMPCLSEKYGDDIILPATVYCDGRFVWNGRSGQVAYFEIEKPTAEVWIVATTLKLLGRQQVKEDVLIKGIVEQGKYYEIWFSCDGKEGSGFADADLTITPVDIR